MLFICDFCDWSHEDDHPEQPIIDVLSERRYPGVCPDCGAVVTPEHIDPDEMPGWYRLFSKCPNAKSCCTEQTYRPECEKLVFYPGCLAFMWRPVHELNLTLRHVYRVTDDDLYFKDLKKD